MARLEPVSGNTESEGNLRHQFTKITCFWILGGHANFTQNKCVNQIHKLGRKTTQTTYYDTFVCLVYLAYDLESNMLGS